MLDKRNKIKKLDDKTYEFSISFDITIHGHSFGMPRNYPLQKVSELIRSKDVQEAVSNGYSLIMYGHGARSKDKGGFLAQEVNPQTGEVQEPLGRIQSLSFKNKIITFTGVLFITDGNKGESIIRMIKNRIGGFSFVWDLKNKRFYGADFVLSPNFNGNRVVMDSICEGNCSLDDYIEDTIIDAIGEHLELYEDAKSLLLNQQNTIKAIEVKDKFKILLDEVATLRELDRKSVGIDKQIKINSKQKELINELEKQNKALEEKVLVLSDEIQDSKDKAEEKINYLSGEVNKKTKEHNALEEKINKINSTLSDNSATITDGIMSVDFSSLLGGICLDSVENNKDIPMPSKNNPDSKTDDYIVRF